MSRRVLGVLAGGDFPADLLKKWADSAEIIIAADGGADLVLSVQKAPDHVVGDLDSISAEALQSAPDLYRDSSQDYTDCDKLLRFAEKRKLFPLTIAGVEGDRLDHVFATVQSASRFVQFGKITLALRKGLAFPLSPGKHSIDGVENRKVSLIPLTRCEGVHTRGLKWELHSEVLDATVRTSISNFGRESSIELSFETGALLVVVERSEQEPPVW